MLLHVYSKNKHNFQDTAGEEKYAGLSSFYCRGASAAILAYDLTRQMSLKVLKDRHIPLLETAEENCFCVVVGTKLDLVNNTTRAISTDVGRSLAQAQNKYREGILEKVPYFETSSKSGENVEDVFSFILNTCLPLDEASEERTSQKKSSQGMIDLDKSHQTNCSKKKCC